MPRPAHSHSHSHEPLSPKWQAVVKHYQQASIPRSIWQVVNTFIPFLVLWYLAYRSLEISYWLTLLLAVPAGGLLVRVFIIFHDCGHGSFFPSRRWNDFLGLVSSLFVLTPYYQWRHEHAIHHATTGDLDRRGIGDIETLTIEEYRALSRWGRLRYRAYRNPLVLFGIGPLYTFMISERFVGPAAHKRERFNVHWTNIALVLVWMAMMLFVGWKAFLLVHMPVLAITATVGVWLFYVQHQFEETYWEHHDDWEYPLAAMHGSSFYKLPAVLQWFSGNIGFHHIHHLSARIPNYNLPLCHKQNPELQQATVLTLRSSFKCVNLTLWDAEQDRLISFREFYAMERAVERAPA